MHLSRHCNTTKLLPLSHAHWLSQCVTASLKWLTGSLKWLTCSKSHWLWLSVSHCLSQTSRWLSRCLIGSQNVSLAWAVVAVALQVCVVQSSFTSGETRWLQLLTSLHSPSQRDILRASGTLERANETLREPVRHLREPVRHLRASETFERANETLREPVRHLESQ